MNVNNHLANAVISSNDKAQYDSNARNILSDKQVLAWILKDSVKEFKEMSLKKIASCIEGEPQVASVPVEPGMNTEVVRGMMNENAVPNEGVVTYDIFFYVRLPKGKRTKIYINVEAQKDYNPGYDIVTRGVFYCARMISSQLGTEFSDSQYDDVKKVYSIWICMNSPRYAADTITKYAIHPENLFGEFKGKARYDLLSVITVCLAKEGMPCKGRSKGGNKLLGMLETLLSSELPAEVKLTKLRDEYQIKTSKKMEEEVRVMCNLSDGIEEKGIAKGIKAGIEQVAVQLIRAGDPDEKIQTVTNLSMERIAQLREQTKE